MGKKAEFEDAHIRVDIREYQFLLPRTWKERQARREQELRDVGQEILDGIARHVDGVAGAYLVVETTDLCEFCGRDWTEGDSPHNGGCCEQDIELMEQSEEVA